MSLGDADIDADHKRLIDTLNRLHYMHRAGDERTEIAAVLDELADYCERHFEREEALMRRCGFPDLDRHAALHRQLRSALDEFARAYHDDPEGFDAAAFYDFVSDWILVHVLDEDMKLRPHLRAETSASGK